MISHTAIIRRDIDAHIMGAGERLSDGMHAAADDGARAA
jgi:hypothetical protein